MPNFIIKTIDYCKSLFEAIFQSFLSPQKNSVIPAEKDEKIKASLKTVIAAFSVAAVTFLIGKFFFGPKKPQPSSTDSSSKKSKQLQTDPKKTEVKPQAETVTGSPPLNRQDSTMESKSTSRPLQLDIPKKKDTTPAILSSKEPASTSSIKTERSTLAKHKRSVSFTLPQKTKEEQEEPLTPRMDNKQTDSINGSRSSIWSTPSTPSTPENTYHGSTVYGSPLASPIEPKPSP
ncbi:MAG: hypothetical protein K0S11_979 [Gammaproteobacteria bacterium]|jgi:hypothetical protein|nr:hypothetical protein [Gammaproteobacteria bacterium]